MANPFAVIDDFIGFRKAKLAVRTGNATYGDAIDVVNATAGNFSLNMATAEREGYNKVSGGYSRANSGTMTLEFASNNLELLATILGMKYAVTGTTPNQLGRFTMNGDPTPYVGFVGAADDASGRVNAAHFFAPRMKVMSDSVDVFAFDGSSDPEFGTVSMEFTVYFDDAYLQNAQNEIQQLDITTNTSGTFTLAFGSDVTSAIAFDATAANIQTALEALGNIGTGNVTVTEGATDVFDIEFVSNLANTNLPLLTLDDTNLDVGGSIAVTQEGNEGEEFLADLYEVEAGTTPTLPPVFI